MNIEGKEEEKVAVGWGAWSLIRFKCCFCSNELVRICQKKFYQCKVLIRIYKTKNQNVN
jgi:hypothetical protein